MTGRRAFAVVVAMASTVPAGGARAEEVVEDSLEWRTCDSDRVVRATVTAVAGEEGVHVVTVRIDEMLKGDAAPELAFRWEGAPERFAAGWEGVLFLREDGGALRLRTPGMPEQSFYRLPLGEGAGRLAFRADMRRIGDARALGEAVRARVARGPCTGGRRLLAAPPPSDAFRLLTRDGTVQVAVPADEAEEARAAADADAREALSAGGGCGSCAVHSGGSDTAGWLAVLLVAAVARRRRRAASRRSWRAAGPNGSRSRR